MYVIISQVRPQETWEAQENKRTMPVGLDTVAHVDSCKVTRVCQEAQEPEDPLSEVKEGRQSKQVVILGLAECWHPLSLRHPGLEEDSV